MDTIAKPTPEEVGKRLGLTVPLTTEQTDTIAAAIYDAQAAVEAELNRPIVPVQYVETGLWPASGYDDLTDPKAWPQIRDKYDDRFAVVSTTDLGDGSYDVTVDVGLDGANEGPIVSFIRAHAAELVRQDPSSGIGQRQVSSVSAEGQSVSYDRGPTAEGAPGVLPTLKTLRRYKRHTVYRNRRWPDARWPYAGTTRIIH